MGWFSSTFLGVDLDAEKRRQEELDAALARLNREKLEKNEWSEAQFQKAEQNRAAGKIDIDKEVSDGFKEGLTDGISNIRKGIGSAVEFPLKFIPWQLWLLAGAGLFLWMGGLALLRGLFSKKAA